MAGFKDIIGHEMIKDHFQKAIEYHKVSHAYTFLENREWKKNAGESICHDSSLREKRQRAMYGVPLLQADFKPEIIRT